jgi:hypothetical protein
MTTYYEKNAMMVGRRVADEFILVPIRQDIGDLQCMYTMNGVGTRIWELINGHTTVEEITSAIVREYEVETPQAKADVVEFLDQMKAIGAVLERQEGK